ncbi:MAG: all-trans-retinol 13,14-reductase [Flavobacteriales bacterium]|nr:MAG: all-trans-retinol 13,14-reductase [Flavobacteriales bacterium]
MSVEEKEYDFVIIGSGLGGLECAYILAEEGYSVVVLEKNHQIGGNLQVFSRDKSIFDTGVHYIGGLDEGENLDQFFKYFGMRDSLKWKRMDEDCFDLIRIEGKEFKYAQGYDKFSKSLIAQFPEEEEAIMKFCSEIKSICEDFPLYNLKSITKDNIFGDIDMLSRNAYDVIASITSNKLLQNVLAATNGLYAGEKDTTPWFVHALVLNSYLTGAYRLMDGGSQISIHLSKAIRAFGGEVLKRKIVTGANFHEDGKIKEVVLSTGETVKGKNFISNVHPAVTIDIFGEKRFLKPYVRRVKNLPNTISSFITHIVFKENTFKYMNYNTYCVNDKDVWDCLNYNQKNWPKGIFVCTPASSKSEEYADCMSIMAYMDYKEVEQWETTFNTVAQKGERGGEYEKFKATKEAKLVEEVEKMYPGIKEHIKSVHSTTPLTFRDYIGDKTGSLYGILKDSNNPLKSVINPKTRIKNLSLTGQNIILHGVLGATIGAFVTCFNHVDKHKLIDKVRNS